MSRIAIALVLLSGCIKGATEDQTETPPPAHNEAVFAAQPEQPRNDAVLASLSDVEAAYFENCEHRVQIEDEESEAMVDECAYVPFDQNCAPDPSGCWDKGQACISECSTTCVSCDKACDNGCTGCKGKCKADDSECVAECARTRAECHDTCMNAKSTCSGDTCPAAETKCDTDHAALKAKMCPKCDKITQCVEDAINSSSGDVDPIDVCGRKFKREPDQCIEWCGYI